MNPDWKESLASLLEDGRLPADIPEESPETTLPQKPTETSSGRKNARKTLRIFFEKKGRAGKPATIIGGFAPDGSEDQECEALAATLKKRLGRGGSARGGEILIQGDCRDRLRELLPELGYRI